MHTMSDFRELNKRIVRKPYPIPKISTILQELEGFTYATALDLNMGYYTIRLDPTASVMCTIIFPWGKYSYKRLPMGFGGSANIFQVGGLVGPLPPFFFLLKILLSRTPFINSGGFMVRQHFPNLALLIFDFAPLLNAIAIITNLPVLAGGYSPPCPMDQQIIAMLEHHEFPG